MASESQLTQTPEQEQALFFEAFQGNMAAVDLCMKLAHITQVWDDLIDKDKPVSDYDIDAVFWNALVEIPSNPFYRQFFDRLNPLVQTFIMDWHVSNELKGESEHWDSIANVLRDSFAAFVVQCAQCIGGYRWARDVAIKIRRFTHTETVQEFRQ